MSGSVDTVKSREKEDWLLVRLAVAGTVLAEMVLILTNPTLAPGSAGAVIVIVMPGSGRDQSVSGRSQIMGDRKS